MVFAERLNGPPRVINAVYTISQDEARIAYMIDSEKNGRSRADNMCICKSTCWAEDVE
jgi:hypothetical protein